MIGNRLDQKPIKIVGISIARKAERGHQVIRECIEEYQRETEVSVEGGFEDILFIDDYLDSGYGNASDAVTRQIADVFCSDSIVLDPIYTGKAFWGMVQYLKDCRIQSQNILFLHTGGLPCLFSQPLLLKVMKDVNKQ